MEPENNPNIHINSKEIAIKVRRFRKKRKNRRRHFYIFSILFFLICIICIIAGFFFSNQISWTSMNKPVTYPTGEDPNFLTQVDDCFLPTAAVYGYDLRITAAYRSIADQTAMFDQGRTVDGHVVSEASPGHSLHNYGYAVDVVDRYKGYDIDWTELVKIGQYCSLESGGIGDLPHFEERGGLSTEQFMAGQRPSILKLPCSVMASRVASGTPLTLQDLQQCGAPDFNND